MKNYSSIILLLLVFFVQCAPVANQSVNIIPKPHLVEVKQGSLLLEKTASISVLDDELKPIAKLLAQKLNQLSGLKIELSKDNNKSQSIVLTYNRELSEEEYIISVDEIIQLEASNYNSMSMAVASLIQMAQQEGKELVFPKVQISDKADYSYRTVMLDLARFWHPVETIKETIDLLWYYKVPYLHLHLSDNRRFTFPLDEFPELKTVNAKGEREYYTIEELNELVEYAKIRGVAIIPEVDLPGHSTQLWQKYPEVFGSIDSKTKKAKTLYVINMAKEETYAACESIIQKLAEVFYTSPYIHFGGDEVYLDVVKTVPEYNGFCKKNDLQEALKGDVDELFCHFINRLHKMVKATGKKTLIWEGFHNAGAGKETISKDISVIVWNTTFNRPDSLISNGYNIVNATWNPWYFVGAMNLAPAQEKGYNWNLTDWSHWDDKYEDIVIEENHSTMGGQICFWEQNHYKVVPVLQERVPVFAERLWNNKSNNDYKEFVKRFEKLNSKYAKLFQPVKIKARNLLSEDDLTFSNPAEIILESEMGSGIIKFVVSNDWDMPSLDQAKIYEKPIVLESSSVLTVQLFNAQGEKVGSPIQKYYQKIEPVYEYKVFGPAPNKGWDEMPDFSSLGLLREGVSGRMTSDRLDKVNGELFAKVKREGHIETRFSGIYNQYAVELTGTFDWPTNDEFDLRLQTHDGLAEIFVDGNLIAKGENFKNEAEDFKLRLQKGNHKISVKYYYRQIQNQLNVLYKIPGMDDFEPFENLMKSF